MLGMRFTFHASRKGRWLTDGTADWPWPAAERAGIPVMVSAAAAAAARVSRPSRSRPWWT